MKKYALSLDGGGVRCIATLTFLNILEKELRRDISECFDYFIGTSSGGISCIGIGSVGMDTDEMLEMWNMKNIKRIMQSEVWQRGLGSTLITGKAKYNPEGKRSVLEDYFGELTFGDSKKPVAVTAYDVEDRSPVLLSSYETKHINLVEAAEATSAAPTFFPTAEVKGNYLIDGGVVENNPAMNSYIEALKIYPDDEIKVLSIGTGLNRRKINGKASKDWGLFGWMTHDLLGIMTETSLQNKLAEDLIGQNYLRVNSSLGKSKRKLDDISKKNIDNIKDMGKIWWDSFGAQTLKLLDE
ncbi:MAG: patatin-like phospholipase family protein [SAR86 cluster bacterium]|nr:patatin-like phospholipase family protein [SAR86 cluster bacterium]